MPIPLSLHPMQAAILLLQPKYNFLVAGRGWGKSTLFGNQIHNIVQHMPGASGIIAAKTFTHVLTSILPSAFAHLERLGYLRDTHYVIGRKPPKEWGLPYQPPVKNYEHYITFANPHRPVGFYLTSQEKEGSGRGPNTDFLLTDETLRLDKAKLDKELGPTLRANKDKFGHIAWHLGEFHSTSMPYTPESRWILEKGNYYIEEYAVDYFSIWRQVISAQLALLDITDPREFRLQWNEINRLRRLMHPRLSKDGRTLFTLSNAFDNIANVGLSYIREQRTRTPELIFLIEIMNAVMSLTEKPYYPLQSHHTYYDGYDDNLISDMALSSGYNFARLTERAANLLNRKYYDPHRPLYLVQDWGGTISFILAAQFDEATRTLYILREEYILPPHEMPRNLMKAFARFFRTHTNKRVYYITDKFGDSRSTSISSGNTINDEAIRQLEASHWQVSKYQHAHNEPPQLEKWRTIQAVLAENESSPITIRIDATNCPYLLISMGDAKVRQVNDKIEKDKTSERRTQDQRTATHASDALDKLVYYITAGRNSITFIDAVI
jgi:hypothetical protein